MGQTIIRTLLTIVVLAAGTGRAVEQPNILLILVDDVGYCDIGAFAARLRHTSADKLYYETPHIDRLARQGTMFTQFYACTVCAPTRASLMTGKMSNRLGMWDAYAATKTTFEKTGRPVPDGCHILDHEPWDEYGYSKTDRGVSIPVAATTLHDVKTLPQALPGYHTAFTGKWHLGSQHHEGYRPEDQGFDQTLAYFDGGGSGYHRPFRAYAARSPQWDKPGAQLTPQRDYLSDDVAQRVNRFLEDRARRDNGEPFFLYLAHPAAHGPIQSRADDLAYFKRKMQMPGLIGHKDPAYAGLIKGMDRSIGRILDKLDELELSHNTAVIFISDNGGHPVFTRNTPLRGGKSMLYEGGVRVPMIVRWPGRTEAGAVCDVTSDIADIYPTLMDMARVDYHDYRADETTDGESLVPLLGDLENRSGAYTRTAFYQFYGKQGYRGFHDFATWATLRLGDYKLHYDYHGKAELYNIAEDMFENNDLLDTEPKRAHDMLVQLTDWLKENCNTTYLPQPNPNFNPEGKLPYGPYVPFEQLKMSLKNRAPAQRKYRDGRPAATLRMDARDHGVVLRYGDGPDQCDMLGARDVWVYEDSGTTYMHYDAAGPKGWLSSLAVSKDLLAWEKKGPLLDFGNTGEDDSAGACYGVTYKDKHGWHMFYLGTPNASSAPDRVPSFPYLTMKARASSPTGPWVKQKDVVPFRTKPNTYYSLTASPGQIIKRGDEYLQFFSSTTRKSGNPCVQRTLGIARTRDLDGPWTVDAEPMVPIEEQIENSSLYYEKSNQTWFLFTNHIGLDKGEYTDAIWVYWSQNLNRWDPTHKAIVLDGQNCSWSSKCIGLPSVVQTGERLALFYDAPGGNSTSHMKRSVGLAWLDLPLKVPETDVPVTRRIKVTDLQCEYRDNPVGIDETEPRLSWKLESAERGQRQTGYRVLVASSRDKLDQDMGDLWESGKVQSDQSVRVAYGGKPLTSRTQCCWKVRVWDSGGNPTAWSESAQWSMGLLDPEDWAAKWITNPAPERLSHPWLRRTFDLKENVERAVIHVNTPSFYELRINGEKVSPYVLTPGISKLDTRFLVNSYDVTSYLVKGSNCIALWMGPGWHQPRNGNKYRAPILRAQLDIQTPSGLTLIGTDANWRVKESCISQIGEWKWNNFGGEHFDAREFVAGWDQADLDDSKWLLAREINAPDVVHSWQGCQSARPGAPVSPRKISQLDNGKWVIDFGRPLTGWLRLDMHGLKSGQEVRIDYADVNDNGNERKLSHKPGPDGFQTFNQKDLFISAGETKETFCSRFNYHSFRYVVIAGLSQKPAIEDAVAMMIEPELDSAGTFECSNELFNQIHEITRYTFRTQNPCLALGTGEAREKSAYGDGGAHLSGYLYNFKCDANLRKWIRDWSDNQRENGFLEHTAPAFEDHGGGPAWGGQLTELVRRMYLYYGDKEIVEQTYDALRKYVDYVESKTEDGILRAYSPTEGSIQWRFIGDWVRPTKEPGSSFYFDTLEEREFFNNCYRALLWQQLQDDAEILGRDGEYKRCREHLAKIRPLIHKTFYLPSEGSYIFSNQGSLTMALYADIPPQDLRPRILARLEHDIVATQNGHLDAGMLGTFLMFDLLTKENRNDLIALIMGQTTYPGWGFLVKEMGLNTWPETWSGWGSQVIMVTATPGAWFFEGLGGILPDPEKPGFKHFTLRPGLVESVDWAKCSYQSPYGEIVSHWKAEEGSFKWNIHVPPNTTATVYVLAKTLDDVTESGKEISKAPGVQFKQMKNGMAEFAVESGIYTFVSESYSKAD